jgi:hypothetical protein
LRHWWLSCPQRMLTSWTIRPTLLVLRNTFSSSDTVLLSCGGYADRPDLQLCSQEHVEFTQLRWSAGSPIVFAGTRRVQTVTVIGRSSNCVRTG